MGQAYLYTAKLKPEMAVRYQELHDNIPDVITNNLKIAGITDLRIYRKGLDLWMMYEMDESAKGNESDLDQAAEDEWQRVTSECFEVEWHDPEEIHRLKA